MIEVLTTLPIQVDGEAWPQPPGVISLKRLPEQVRVTTTAIYTRQMMIIAGGKPELCCGMARHGMLSERVGSMHAHICMHYMCASLIQNAVWTCCAYVERVLCEVTGEKNYHT